MITVTIREPRIYTAGIPLYPTAQLLDIPTTKHAVVEKIYDNPEGRKAQIRWESGKRQILEIKPFGETDVQLSYKYTYMGLNISDHFQFCCRLLGRNKLNDQ